jgi:ankyrin repeat protein
MFSLAKARMFPVALACTLTGSAAAQPTDRAPPIAPFSERFDATINATEEHARLFEFFSSVIGAALNGGEVCAADWPQVRLRKAELARAIAGATPATGPLVLHFAVAANSLPDVRRLLEAGASREDPWGTQLHSAARFADPPMLEYLVARGFGIEDIGNAAAPALFVAATENRMDNVAWLVEHGADVNATDRQGGQLLTHALMCRDQKLIDYLLAAGATPNSKTRDVATRLGLSVGD